MKTCSLVCVCVLAKIHVLLLKGGHLGCKRLFKGLRHGSKVRVRGSFLMVRLPMPMNVFTEI